MGRAGVLESVAVSTNPYVVGFRLGRNAVDRAQLAALDDMLRVNIIILDDDAQDMVTEACICHVWCAEFGACEARQEVSPSPTT